MQNPLTIRNYVDESGNPAGGFINGRGLMVNFQDGPLGRGDDRQDPNGAFVEDLIVAAMSRLSFYQRSKFACAENDTALSNLAHALEALQSRTAEREARGVEGTHTV